ncbi:MAG TPA: DUF2357 domain-containing protein [Nannocystis sp.]|jgi:hypothetical protein
MKIVIVDLHGHTVLVEDDGTFVLEEDRHYQVLAAGASEARLDARLLLAANPGCFVLPIDRWVGATQLQLETADGPVAARVRVRPRSEKLSEALWATLLEELEAWLPGVTPGLAGGKQGAVGSEGVSATLFAEALLPLLPALEDALRVVLAHPRVADRIEPEDRPLRQIRRVESSTIAWLGRHPTAGAWLHPWRAAEQIGAPPLVPATMVDATLDHPANRYIAWILRTAIARLREAADILDRRARRPDDSGAWCAARAERARTGADRLATLRDRSFLRRLSPTPATEAALLVIADDIAYARLHALGRRFCSPRFRLHGAASDPAAAVRPSYSLYELWCLLAVERSLRSCLADWTWSSRNTQRLLDLASTGEGIRFDAVSPAGARLGIEFNPTFYGWFNHGHHPRFSLSGERRPDLVLTLDTPGGTGRWVVLDAKYRAGRRNLADAFESLHIYRDALRDEDRGGACLGGLLLAPQPDQEIQEWFAPSWRTRWGIGAVALAPGGTADELVEWLLVTLGL